ncbi:hypothetical protein M885DRAFT_577363 [Pelagophyceae sp. CCMP2097]|nr:hypothetical protein M885DRAFT_577363 [Pelagophyceae sp. CCMP2097]
MKSFGSSRYEDRFAVLALLLADASAFAPAARATAAKGAEGWRRGAALLAAPTDTVVIQQDFKLAAASLGDGAALSTVPWAQVSLGPVVTLLGVIFLIMSLKLRFTFDANAFELRDERENMVVGGANRWNYNKFVNYEFFPKG